MPEELPRGVQAEYNAIDERYRRDVALIEARPKLEAAFFFSWFLLDVACVAFFIATVGWYVISGSFTDQERFAETLQYAFTPHAVTAVHAPRPLEIVSVQTFVAPDGAVDMFGVVRNGNKEWVGNFTYVFRAGNQETAARKGFVLPGSEAPVLALQAEFERRPSGAQLVIQEMKWERIDKQSVGTVEGFLETHNQFTVADATYVRETPVAGAPASTTPPDGVSTFTITNRSAYGFWEPRFLVSLERNGSVVAVSPVTVPQFLPGETRTISLRWQGDAPVSATVSVKPWVNFFDPTEYISPRGQPSTDLRDIRPSE